MCANNHDRSAREKEEEGRRAAHSTAARKNLELKARCQSLVAAEEAARSIGAAYQGVLHQEDHYFNVPLGRLKIRLKSGAQAELIQYERAENSAERWSDYIATPLVDASAVIQALDRSLGTRVVVRKDRHLYMIDGARIHLDDVEGLGTFLEFEVTIEDPGPAEERMTFLRKTFAIDERSILRCSYADLMLAGA